MRFIKIIGLLTYSFFQIHVNAVAQTDHYDPYSAQEIDTLANHYYEEAVGLVGTNLKVKLNSIIKHGHYHVSYGSIWGHFETLDKKPDGTVWDIYTDIPGGTPVYTFDFGSISSGGHQCGGSGPNTEGYCFNREHSWPRTWFGGQQYPMNSDMHHMYPVDREVNAKRSNFPYGVVAQATWTSSNGSKLGTGDPVANYGGYGGAEATLYFEPIDEYKGDLARTYFYMSTRYYGEDGLPWKSDFPNAMGAELRPWTVSLLLDWHRQDPVSDKEVDRNNGIYYIQGNRNPFVDYPLFVECVWGDQELCDKDDPVFLKELEAFKWKIFPNPAQDYIYIATIDKPLNDIRVEVWTIEGKMIPVDATQVYDTQWSVSLNFLSSGMYFINIVSDGKAIQRKFIKQ